VAEKKYEAEKQAEEKQRAEKQVTENKDAYQVDSELKAIEDMDTTLGSGLKNVPRLSETVTIFSSISDALGACNEHHNYLMMISTVQRQKKSEA
jgi:hypothetical protein